MKARILIGLLLSVAAVMLCGTAWALDEAVLTPTPERSVAGSKAMTEKDKANAEEEFNAAMSVWFKHDYKNGEGLLGEFAKKYPHSKWRAEAELHQGCYLTFTGQKSKAKPIFQRLMNEFAGTNIAVKARLRLASIFEQEMNEDEAIRLYASVLKLHPTWDQFKYANFHGRLVVMAKGQRQARIKCGPVALASCLETLGKEAEAAKAREIAVTPDGLSLASLELSCLEYGVPARTIEMSLDELQKADLPVLAYVEPKHFVAVLEIKDGKAQIEDSIRGKYEASFDQLKSVWAGKVLTFAPKDDMKPLTQIASLEAVGGCCGQIAESECQGCPEDCKSGGYPPGGGDPGGGGPGVGGSGGFGGDNVYTMGGGGSPCPDCNKGRPGWKVNTSNLNLLVTDTPIWYNPGRGYSIAFTLNYSNENSNTGIFGRSWRCVYDMRVFFGINNLQVHRDTGRIETYVLSGSAYVPNPGTANLGYRDEIGILDASQAAAESRTGSPVYTGSVRITRRGGGKYFFLPASYPLETQGRIYIIEDNVGKRVTCDYTGGKLSAVIDANGGVTVIETTGSGPGERVTMVTIPDGRHASFGYDGYLNLTSITDMAGVESRLSYGQLGTYGSWDIFAATTLAQNVTAVPLVPDNGETLRVASTEGFPEIGRLVVSDNPWEWMTYEGKTGTDTLTGIRRGVTPIDASTGSRVETDQPFTTLSNDITAEEPGLHGNLDVASSYGFPNSGSVTVWGTQVIDYSSKSLNPAQLHGITRRQPASSALAGTTVYFVNRVNLNTPYLDRIETPSKKTKFTYEFWSGWGLYGLHEVYECGPSETTYPTVPTIHYVWCGGSSTATRYPTKVSPGDPCMGIGTGHWTGGLTRSYPSWGEDALGGVVRSICSAGQRASTGG